MILRLCAFAMIIVIFVTLSIVINLYTSVGNWSETWLLIVAVFNKLVAKITFTLKSLLATTLKTVSSLRLVEVVMAFLVLRFRRLLFMDIPFRVTSFFAPYVTTNLRVRRLLRYRMGVLRKIFVLKVRKYWSLVHVGLEPYFGQYTRMVIWLMVSVVVVVLLFFFTGLWLIVGFVPLPQPVRVFFSGVWQFIRGLIQPLMNAVTQAIFRSTVFVMIGAFWLKLVGVIVSDERRRALRIRRRRLIRHLFLRRKAAEQRIRRVSWLEKVIHAKFNFWDRLFATRVLPTLDELQAVPNPLRYLEVPVQLTQLAMPPCIAECCCVKKSV